MLTARKAHGKNTNVAVPRKSKGLRGDVTKVVKERHRLHIEADRPGHPGTIRRACEGEPGAKNGTNTPGRRMASQESRRRHARQSHSRLIDAVASDSHH